MNSRACLSSSSCVFKETPPVLARCVKTRHLHLEYCLAGNSIEMNELCLVKQILIFSSYELYYDLYKDGEYSHMIAEMHARFGKVVRIAPKTLHIADPIYYKQLLANYSWFIWPRYPSPHATFSPEDLRRFRPGIADNRKVSMSRLAAVGTVISAKLAEFCDMLDEAQVAEHDIRMNMVFFNLAAGEMTFCAFYPTPEPSSY